MDAAQVRVQLFPSCMVDSLFPAVGEAAVRVLRSAGTEPSFNPQQTCCGQPLFNAGFHDLARRQALPTIELFEGTDDPLIIPSGSCAAMIRHGYLELLRHDLRAQARAQRLARRTYEFSEFLVDVIGWAPARGETPTFIYHASCHLQRGLGVDRQPIHLLEQLTGRPVDALAPECCGFGGLFSVELPEVSQAMLDRRLDQIEAHGAEFVVSADAGCLMHLEGGLRRRGSRVRGLHLSQALAGDWSGLR